MKAIQDIRAVRSLDILNIQKKYIETGDTFYLTQVDSLLMWLMPILAATNFHVRIPKGYAEILLGEGSDDVMCKEYGQDEDWVGLTADDLDGGELDEDYKTLELMLSESTDLNQLWGLLEDIYNHVGPSSIESYKELLNII